MKRSIYSLIHDDLKRMLIVTLSISAVLLLVSAILSFKRMETQAARFVMSHVERLAQDGISAQDVGAIDTEIARFSQTWKETQDLDLRIDIYLNGKQISHAGQLRPFAHFSPITEKELSPPSGDKLRVELQIDMTSFILYGVLKLLAFESAILALFYILSRSMQRSIRHVTRPLEAKIAWLKAIAHDLPRSARDTGTFTPVEIAEIDDLGESIGSLTRQIVALEDNLAKVNFDRGRLKMAEQVAHNIKGVVATLQLKVNRLPVGSDKERQGLLDCITSLQAISEGLLKAKKLEQETKALAKPKHPIQVLPVLKAAVDAKHAQYEANASITISISRAAQALSSTVRVDPIELQNVISNLIDNSVEAFGKNGGRVEVDATASGTDVRIYVRDNGSGIPEAVLPALMKEGFSYGKENGNGIGLFYAKEVLEAAAGSIAISSVGNGTVVELRLPLADAPDAQVAMIQIREKSTLVCVDDDMLIHAIWKQRLAGLIDRVASVIHLSSVSAFESWLAAEGHGDFGSRLYLFDFDLKDSRKTGLDLISEHGLALESILVSGMAEVPEVRERAAKMGLRRLSKDFLDVVPIEIEGHGPQASAESGQAVQGFKR